VLWTSSAELNFACLHAQYIHYSFTQGHIYYTTADVAIAGAADHYLVNGCDDFGLQLNRGEWTRLRILHNSHSKNAVVRFVDSKLKSAKCELNLLALDGIYLAE
jgi:hypothetical protein